MSADQVWRELFWQMAKKLNCLPSTFPDANDHVFRAADRYIGLACKTCNGHGLVGGMTIEGGEGWGCPDCQGSGALAAIACQGDAVRRNYLNPADLGDLMRFQETTEDDEGYDIGKPAIKRLAELGVVQSHGFGKYSLTEFGGFVLDHMFGQNPALPLMTNEDRNRAATTAKDVK